MPNITFDFLTGIKRIDSISGAIYIVFEDNLAVWIPPQNNKPFFTQPSNYLIDESLNKIHYKMPFLTEAEIKKLKNLITESNVSPRKVERSNGYIN